MDATRRRWAEVPPNVWGLGLTSLFTDASSELVTSVLPLYLVVHRGLSPLGFGLVDGLQQGLAATLSLGSGLLSDRLGRHKRVAAAGYAVSAVCRLALLPAGAQLSALAAITAADRIGKSIRTPSRDALLSLSARPEALGFAFGVHRSLDAAGALLGPLLAFALLARRPVGFEELFVVAFLVATGGLAALLLLVRDVRPAAASIPAPPPALGRLLADPAPRRLALAAAVLGLATVGDGFVFLAFQSASDLPASGFPLLAAGTALVHFALAAPLGRLADRVGRRTLYLAGHGPLLLAYACAALAGPGWTAPALGVVLLGVHHAATDGVVMALAASRLPRERLGSGLALVGTATGLARLAASLLLGWLWSRGGHESALLQLAGVLGVALVVAALALRRDEATA